MCTLSSSLQTNHISKESSRNPQIKQSNPWMERDLQELGWSEFMKKKAGETLKSLDEKTIENSRRKKTLARTSSAPVNITGHHKRPPRNNQKKELVRVSSTGPGAGASHRLGGSPRIIYDRDFLLHCRESPLSSTPPTDLPVIPGATAPIQRRSKKILEKTDSNISAASTTSVSSATSNIRNNEA